MANRKVSFKDFLWKVWISAPQGKIRSTSESATTESARVPAEERWKLRGTRFHETCTIVRRFTSRRAIRAGLDFPEPRIPTRFFPVRPRWMDEGSRGILWGSEFRGITVDTGIAISGLGRMRFSPALTHVRAHWKHWYTKCHLGSSFARACSGMRERNTNSGICKRSEETQMDLHGIFVVPRRVDCEWNELSMARAKHPSSSKTDCKGSFEVAYNSLAKAVLRLEQRGRPAETLETSSGAVLEMVGR